MMQKLPRLPKFPGYSSDGRPLRFVICDVCRQRFDSDDPDQVFHHGPEPHKPLELAAHADEG
jgi:hypothetical protein